MDAGDIRSMLKHDFGVRFYRFHEGFISDKFCAVVGASFLVKNVK